MNSISVAFSVSLIWISVAQAASSSPSPTISSHDRPGDATGEDFVEKSPLYLGLGEQRLLQIPALKRYSLGGKAVRSQPMPGSSSLRSDALLLKGAEPGVSDLWVWKTTGEIEHRSIDVQPLAASHLKPELLENLERLSEVEVIYSGAGVGLRGEIRTMGEAERITELVRAFPSDVHDETEPSDALIEAGKQKIESWLAMSPYANRLEIAREDRTLRVFISQGSLRGPTEKAALERRVHSLYPLAQTEFDALPDTSPTVHFEVFLLELKKSRFHNLGLSWPASQDSAFRVTTSAVSDLLSLDLALQSLEGDGSLKILSNPELVVRAPGEAELFSGGEIPIQSKTAYFSAVTWKNFGLTLKLNVAQSAGDKVRLDISTEVSHLDSSLSNETIPGIQANRMKTQVDAQYGKPLLLSGLLQQNMRREAKGLPFLRQIPVLGALFGSEDYLNEKSELVAILVPSKELPQNPMSRLRTGEDFLPKGSLPISRTPAKPALSESDANYPWNVLE